MTLVFSAFVALIAVNKTSGQGFQQNHVQPPRLPPANRLVRTPASSTQKPAPTLADAVKYVLAEYQKLGTGPVRVGQLYDAVQQAGYKFGSASRENNLNYMSKVLRENNAFKRVSLGLYALA